MLQFILALMAAVRVFFRSRNDTALEILALRQQLVLLKRKRPRPRLNSLDRLFWITLHCIWSRWAEVLVAVKPETVIGCSEGKQICSRVQLFAPYLFGRHIGDRWQLPGLSRALH
jgi:hypothetical protein